jgi:hypothetical protein
MNAFPMIAACAERQADLFLYNRCCDCGVLIPAGRSYCATCAIQREAKRCTASR